MKTHKPLKVLCVFGTRPEAIKMAPVIRALESRGDRVSVRICVTAQHREMLDQMLSVFDLHVHHDLNIMKPDQALALLTARLFTRLDTVIVEEQPDWILAQGDTTTAFVTAMAAFYRRIRFAHVEAGLRTHDLHQPFPEEANRRIADLVADLLFAPTAQAQQNLLAENIPADRIHLTGNTVVDALLEIATRSYDWSRGPLASVPQEGKLILVTAHRRENFGEPLRRICEAVRALAQEFSRDRVHFVFPVHLNPAAQRTARHILENVRGVNLLQPLDYVSLVHLMRRCQLILTDSGGIQEEAPTFHVPVLVLREKTERPEGVSAGVARVIGTETTRIMNETRKLLTDEKERHAMTIAVNPYGDGQAGRRIADTLLHYAF